MSTDTAHHSETMALMRRAAEKAVTGIRDREDMRKAAEEMDRLREEIRKREGVLNIGVEAIRELRDS